MMGIGVINYGAGNFGSVWNALTHLELDPVEVRAPSDLDGVSHAVLPGVGAFGAAMDCLDNSDWGGAVRHHIETSGKPFLGICVGMQVLADEGQEFDTRAGLGIVGGRVVRIAPDGSRLPIPHVGWSPVSWTAGCPLFDGLPPMCSFYFVHSYELQPAAPDVVVATCDYGGPLAAAIQHDHVFGVQFHPEKSQRDGLKLLRNFAKWTP